MFIEAKDDGGDGDNWSYKSCKAPVKSSPTNQHPVFLQAGCPSCHPTNSVKALKGKYHIPWTCLPQAHLGVFQLCLWPLIAPGYLCKGLPCLSSALWCQYPTGILERLKLNYIKQISIAPYGRNFRDVGHDDLLLRWLSLATWRPGVEPVTCWSQVQCPNHYATEPHTHNVVQSGDSLPECKLASLPFPESKETARKENEQHTIQSLHSVAPPYRWCLMGMLRNKHTDTHRERETDWRHTDTETDRQTNNKKTNEM